MKQYCRTDLACESSNDLSHIEGTAYTIEDRDICVIEKLDIQTKKASNKLGRKIGKYITVSTPKLQYLDDSEMENLSHIISKEIISIMCESSCISSLSPDFSIFAVGLGNSKMIADAIGPEAIDRITVTRHLKDQRLDLFNELKMCTVSALSPNVLGKTGIESAEIIKAAAHKIRPNVVIAIDALASRSVERLARTIQISNTGITPGSGIGNRRSELSLQSLGIPVISIGIPTVVDSSVLAFDALSSAGISQFPDKIIEMLDSMENFFVTPKEIDIIIEKSAVLVARALEKSFVISDD